MSTEGRPVMANPEDQSNTGGLVALADQMVLVEADSVEVTGRVVGVAGSALTIACDEEHWFEPETRHVTISVFAPDALYRLTGPALVSGSEVVTTEAVSVERIQRRKWPRRSLDLPVTVCPTANGMHTEGVPGRTVNVSIGGLCVETLRPVEGEGSPMVILSLPDGTTIASEASRVTSEDLGDGWRYRLAFEHLDAHAASRLAELTTD